MKKSLIKIFAGVVVLVITVLFHSVRMTETVVKSAIIRIKKME